LLDNDGNFVFTKDSKNGNRDNSNSLSLATKAPLQDSIIFHEIDLQKYYIDEVKVKIDNLNKKYLLNTFYYKKNRGSIEGLFTYVWDRDSTRTFIQDFTILGDTLRDEAKTNGQLRFALDDFFYTPGICKKRRWLFTYSRRLFYAGQG